ncbi:MarR family winged helix-turn-helix transcriptional regulator [Streptomyces sp. NPDC005438]|uniref:MarR family winged helix-turn-helix transcriptional regulator n=1 Tax=Streptomyces sp. NPDC005438 TaxID=3156880 RepID=UPI0033A1FD11
MSDGPTSQGTPQGTSLYRELARRLRAVNSVNRELARALPHDCPPAAMWALSLVHQHGEMRLGRMAELMGTDISVASRHVTHAVEQDWLSRAPDPLDRRSRTLRLTPKGQRFVNQRSEELVLILERRLAHWPTEDIDRLSELLGRLHESFIEDPPPQTPARGVAEPRTSPEVAPSPATSPQTSSAQTSS